MGQESTSLGANLVSIPKGQHSLRIQNRFLLYENNYLRCVNNLISELGQGKKVEHQFAEPDQSQDNQALRGDLSEQIKKDKQDKADFIKKCEEVYGKTPDRVENEYLGCGYEFVKRKDNYGHVIGYNCEKSLLDKGCNIHLPYPNKSVFPGYCFCPLIIGNDAKAEKACKEKYGDTCGRITVDRDAGKILGCRCGYQPENPGDPPKYPYSSQLDCVGLLGPECKFMPAKEPDEYYKGHCRCAVPCPECDLLPDTQIK